MPPQSTHTKWIAPVIALLILGGLIFLGLRSAKEPTVVEPTDTVTPSDEWPSQAVREEKIVESSKGYDITASYPITKSEGITATLRAYVTDQIETFKSDTGAEELPEGYRPMSLEVTYEEKKSGNADTYVFHVYADTGGAHGLQATKTFNFNRVGEVIALADLFTNGTKGLSTIVDYVRKELSKEELTTTAWIEGGTMPTETNNYQNFIVSDQGVTFIFDPYQVAAYAAGTKTITVPVSVFKSIANPELFE